MKNGADGMTRARLTVFLLTYNHAKYIRKAFDSILEQETDFPFKTVVLDDASTDGTSDIVREYAQKYPDRITPVIRKKNLGVAENIYRAFCGIDTEYFILTEGDDFWCNKMKLQQQVDLLDAHPDYDICGHDALVKNFSTGEENRMFEYEPTGAVMLMQGLDLPKVHLSARVLRHVYDFSKVSPKEGVVFDSCTFWYYALQNPKLIYINTPMSVYNYTGEGIYSGASRARQKLMGLKSIVAVNEALLFKYEDFNRKRFRKMLFRRHRVLFSLAYFFMKRNAYGWFIGKYAHL
jgi:glycosyltransferase involved in cell wall biosynthesis